MLSSTSEIKDAISQKVQHFAKESQSILKEKYPDFFFCNLVVRTDFSPRRTSHRGGLYVKGPGINIAGNELVYAYKGHIELKFNEYASYANDPVIGNAFCKDWEQYTMLTVAHEMGHAAQDYICFRDKIENEEPHGRLFKSIYGLLRQTFNKRLIDQKEASSEYRSVINYAKKVELNA